MLRLHDTATGTVRPLALRRPGQVSMYVCGPTVYDAPHLGHGRFALAFDVLRRYLLFCGLDVTYVSNVTDIEDKIIRRAAEQGIATSELTAQWEAVWWETMDRLGVLRPDETPHATAYVEQMVALIGELVAGGAAYETADGVYLSVGEVPGYGLLARQPLESLRAGARVEADEEKRSPLDFVLWKKAKPGEPTWGSPWGPGRPGWHTECVVMSLDLLGEGFDLHGGAIDLAFPHHENERAQAVAVGRDFAHHWVHNGFVEVAGEKMSKSLGNFSTLDELLAETDGRAYRLLVLQSHYRSPIEITPVTVARAEASLARLDELARRFALDDPLAAGPVVGGVAGDGGAGPVGADGGSAGGGPAGASSAVGGVAGDDVLDAEALSRFTERMDDDLDTPAAVAGIYELVRQANAAADAGQDQEAARLARTVAVLSGALGLALRPGGAVEGEPDEPTRALAADRDVARAARDWARADAIRDQLTAAGWVVEDSPTGTRLRR